MPNNPLNLDEAREWAGVWWLPDEPNEKVPGVLRYDPEEGLSLSLIGTFEDRIITTDPSGWSAVHAGTRTWEVMHGVAERREITLLGCVPKSTTRTFGARVKSPDRQTVTAVTAIVGAHVSGDADQTFAGAEVSVEDLEVWAASSALERRFDAADGKADGTGSISMKPVEEQSVVVDGTEYRLVHTYTLPFFERRKGGTVGRMRDTVSIRVAPAEPFSLSTALHEARFVQDLISLAMHRAAGVIWLRLEVAGSESQLPDGQILPRRRADVLYRPPALGKHDADAINPSRVFFTCESLPFEEVIPRWREAHDRLQAATNMILGLRYAPARFIESNLLTAVGAAEVLHRNLRIDEKPFPAEEFKAMRDAMLDRVPTEYQDRFKSAIRNDPMLRDRLRALAMRPDQEAIAKLIPEVDHWTRRTTRARNDLAHEGRTPNHTIEELFAIVEVTTAVVILNVLNELGLPAEWQRDIVQKHPQLSATFHTASEWLVAPDSVS